MKESNTAAESYMNLIGELIGSGEKDALKEKLKIAINKFYFEHHEDKENFDEDDIKEVVSKEEYEELKSARDYWMYTSGDSKQTRFGYYIRLKEKLMEAVYITKDPLGLNPKIKQENLNEDKISFGAIMTIGIMASGVSIIFASLPSAVDMGPINFAFYIPAAIIIPLFSFIGGSYYISQQTEKNEIKRSKEEKRIVAKINQYFDTPQLQYEFLTEVFPAVLDDHLKEIGEDTISNLNKKQDELQRLLTKIHNHPEDYTFDQNETSEITRQVGDKCHNIAELILQLNDYIGKLDDYKEKTLETLNVEKGIYDKAQRSDDALAQFEAIGIEINDIGSKVDNWTAIIDNRFTDLAIEGGQALREAKFLLES